MDEYLKSFIHALRSPLTAIFSNLELLINGYIGNIDPESKEILNEVLFNAKYMEILMKNTTDVFNDTQDFINQEINLSQTINSTLDKIKSSIENINDILDINIDENITIKSYPDLIERLFLVILFELLKFASEENKLCFFVKKNNTIDIKFYYKNSETNSKEIKHIFNEIFFKPTQKHCKMNLMFFDMVLNKLNAEKKIIEQNKYINFIITVPKS